MTKNGTTIMGVFGSALLAWSCSRTELLNGGNSKSMPSSVATSSSSNDESEKEDQKAEEPQMVSGAFLTCARISASDDRGGQPSNLEPVGCALKSRTNKKIMVSDTQISIKQFKGDQALDVVSRRAPIDSPWNIIVFLPPEGLFVGRLALEVAPKQKGQQSSFEFNLEGLQDATIKAIKEESAASATPQSGTTPATAPAPDAMPSVPATSALGSDVKPSHTWSSDTVYMVSNDFYPSMFCNADGSVKAVLEYPVPIKYLYVNRSFVTATNLSIKAEGPSMDQPTCFGKFENREDNLILTGNPRVLSFSNCLFMQDYKNLYIFDAATIKSDPDKYSVSRLDKIALSKMPCSR